MEWERNEEHFKKKTIRLEGLGRHAEHCRIKGPGRDMQSIAEM